jgi:cation transport ATPase
VKWKEWILESKTLPQALVHPGSAFFFLRMILAALLLGLGFLSPTPLQIILHILATAVLWEDCVARSISDPFPKSMLYILPVIVCLISGIDGSFTAGVAGTWVLRLVVWLGDWLKETQKTELDALDVRPPTALVFRDRIMKEVASSNVRIGEPVIVPPGGIVPVDFVVVRGESTVTLPKLLGSQELTCEPDTSLYAGSLNGKGLLAGRASSSQSDSLLGRRLLLLNSALLQDGPRQQRLQRIVLPISGLTIFCCFILAIFSIWAGPVAEMMPIVARLAWVCLPFSLLGAKALLSKFLVACASVGMHFRNIGTLEQLGHVKRVVFDQSALQTPGSQEVVALSLGVGVNKDTLLECAAISQSTNALDCSYAVLKYCQNARGVEPVIPEKVETFPGGVVAHFSGHVIHAGNADFFLRSRIAFTPEEVPALYVSLDDRLLGELYLSDQFRPGVEELVKDLNEFSMETVMMSPATQVEAQRLGKRIQIRDIHADLNEEKYDKTLDELIFETNGHAAFVTANEVPKLWKKASPGIQTGALQANHWAPVAICGDSANLLGPVLVRSIRNARLMRFMGLLSLFTKVVLIASLFVWEYTPMILAVIESLFTAVTLGLGLMLAKKGTVEEPPIVIDPPTKTEEDVKPLDPPVPPSRSSKNAKEPQWELPNLPKKTQQAGSRKADEAKWALPKRESEESLKKSREATIELPKLSKHLSQQPAEQQEEATIELPNLPKHSSEEKPKIEFSESPNGDENKKTEQIPEQVLEQGKDSSKEISDISQD